MRKERKRLIAKVVALQLMTTASLMIALPSASADGQTFFVATSGSDSNLGNQESPFATIHHAIEAAGSGDTIKIAAGEYQEPGKYILDKDLNIVGAGMDQTIIHPTYSPTSYGSASCADQYCGWWELLSGANVSLSGLTLDGQELAGTLISPIRNGIYVTGNAVIDSVKVKNIIESADGKLIVSWAIHQGWMGTSNMTLSVIHSVLENFGAAGIQTDAGNLDWNLDGTPLYSSTVSISDNLIKCRTIDAYGSDFTWANSGVYVTGGAHATVSGNTIVDCTGTTSYGEGTMQSSAIMVESNWASGSAVTATNNKIENCTYGLYIFYGDSQYFLNEVTFNKNWLSSAEKVGFELRPIDAIKANVSMNWWGQKVGPMGQIENPDGFYESPWITEYTIQKTKPESLGFWPTKTTSSQSKKARG